MRRFTCRVLIFTGLMMPASFGYAQSPTSNPSAVEKTIQLNFPDNVDLKLLVDYVSQRLNVNFYFDEQVLNQKITLRAPVAISESSLMPLLESVLQSRGLVLTDADQPGWKRIVPAANLINAATTQPATRPSSVVTQVFALTTSDPMKLEPLVRPFLTQPGGSVISIADQKLLLVTDFASTVQRIADLIQKLDHARASVVTKFVKVQNVDATAVGLQITALLAAKAKSQGELTPSSVEVITEPRTNQLIFVGPADAAEQAMMLVSAFDIKLSLETKAYRFESVSPQRVDRLIKELIGPTDSKIAYSSVIDAESATLIVSTTPPIHERLIALKRDLDQPVQEQQSSPIRFYKLQNSTATEVLSTIQAIVSEGSTADMGVEGLGSRPNVQPARREEEGRSGQPPSPMTIPGLSAPLSDQQNATGPSNQPRQTVKAKDATITADPNTNAIIVVGPPEAQFIYEQLIKTLDKRRPQVLVECTVVTLDTTGNFQFGVEISGRGGAGSTDVLSFSSFGLSSVGSGDAASGELGRLALTPGVGFNGTVIAGDIAEVVIRALTGNSRAKVVSAPKLLVNDNTAATLASVTEAPFTTTSALTGNTSSTSFGGFAQAGTTITITPHISEGEFLQLEYSIALNSFTDEPQAGASTPPPRRSNQLQSKVTVPDGNTIVVGGLKLKSQSNSKSAIPVLGEIPVLEWFFSNRSSKETESTLFVFIRPVILRDDQFADLKFFSASDLKSAGIPGDFPQSEPLLLK